MSNGKQILPFLVHTNITDHMDLHISQHQVIYLFYNSNTEMETIMSMSSFFIADVSFGIFRSLLIFYLGNTVLTSKCGKQTLGFWKSILSSLQT